MNSNELPATDTYSSDDKLNFLCSLDLFPTPLIKKCPNATKRWLRAVPKEPTIQDIGINARYEIDHSPTKIDFIAVCMVDATQTAENNLIFSSLSSSDSILCPDNLATKVTTLQSKNEHTAFDFDKEKCIYTLSEQNSMGPITSIIPSNIANRVDGQNSNSMQSERPDTDKTTFQHDYCRDLGTTQISNATVSPEKEFETNHFSFPTFNEKTNSNPTLQTYAFDYMLAKGINKDILTITSAGKPCNHLAESSFHLTGNKVYGDSVSISSVNVDNQEVAAMIQELPKKTDVNHDLQDIVINEIISQEINQTIFARATIGKTQGYLSELLRTSKLLEDKSQKDYRRTRHNLEKIKQFLKKPKHERKRIYNEASQRKSVSSSRQEKQKRTILSDDVKSYLSNYFSSHDGKLSADHFQELSSQLKLDAQNVKIFHKNWKQRTKMKEH